MIVEEEVVQLPDDGADTPEGVMRFLYRDEAAELEITARAELYRDFYVEGAFEVDLVEVSVTVNPRGAEAQTLTAEVFRLVPIGEIRQRLKANFAALVDSPVKFETLSPEVFEAARKAGPTDETLKLFADVYLNAERYGGGPIVETVKLFGISRATASRWGQLARGKGLLPPLQKGRDGGSKA